MTAIPALASMSGATIREIAPGRRGRLQALLQRG
jgi:hypothetical protein